MNKDKLKEIDIRNHTCYCFEDIININDLNVDILINRKSNENILIQNVVYKSPYGANRSFIIFENVDRCIKKYDSTKYLALLPSDEKYEIIFDRIRHLIILKGILPMFVLINIQKSNLVWVMIMTYAKCSKTY